MDHIFLSDVHLGAFTAEENQKIESELITLIQFCADKDIQIHLLGDLFDYWMEYPSHIPPLGEKLLSEFKIYHSKMLPVTYILGNHDNWTRGHFAELGFNVNHESVELSINNKNIFLHHGDGLSEKSANIPRPILHRFLRSTWFTSLYQFILPPRVGIRLMKWFSDYSRRGFTFEPEVLNSWSESFLKRNECDYIICGHDHIPRVETFSDGTYINTGTFFQHRTMAYYTNHEFHLVRWNAEQKKFLPFIQPN